MTPVLTGLSAGAVAAAGPSGPVSATDWDPSGVPMPVGDLPGWHQIFADNFANESDAVGSFTGCTRTGCSGTPTVNWGAAPDGTPDGGTCEYYPSQTLSISGGLMTVHFHTNAKTGVCMGADLHPDVPAMTYGMYSIRFRADPVLGYKMADLFWPVDGLTGEIDFPEDHDLTSTIKAFVHKVAGGSQFVAFKSTATTNTWHTATVQWTPTSITFILDGSKLGSTNRYVPHQPMYVNFDLRSQLLGAPKPLPSEEGNLQIDWATVYSYVPVLPTVSGVVPAAIARGASNVTLTLTGSGFTKSSSVSFSTAGVSTSAPPTLVSSTEMTVPVSVTNSAALGTTDVAVTNFNGTGTCAACLTLARSPIVTGAAGQAVVGSTTTVTVQGDRFAPGASVAASVAGISVGKPSSESDTSITVPVTVTSGTAAGSYDLVVTDPNGISAPCHSCLTVLGPPGAPTVDAVTPGNGEVTVTFSPPSSDGGEPVQSYAVSAVDLSTPANGGQTVASTASPVVVQGLTNGDTYEFLVTAVNQVGTGPESAPSPSVVPATLPGAPTAISASLTQSGATVSFAAPASDGGARIQFYTVTVLDRTDPAAGGQTVSGSSSPIVVPGLVSGHRYRFVVTATNSVGSGSRSKWSNPVTP